LLGRLGRNQEANDWITKGIALDPLEPRAYSARFNSLYAARDYAAAAAFSENLERSRPEMFNWPERLAVVLVFLGRIEEAEHYLRTESPHGYLSLLTEAMILARTGKRNQIAGKIEAMKRDYGDAASYQIAELYALMGDKDAAFASLDRAFQIQDSGLLSIKIDELMDPLRSDPRFDALLRKMNFPA
jgi:tetratricopeptide (TPR) repeat protein